MQFHKLTINITLAIATIAGLQPIAHAETKYDFIAKQIEPQIVQPQAIWLKPQVATQPASPDENSDIHQERKTFFSHPPQLIQAAALQIGTDIPSTYEFTLTVPKDAGESLKAVKVVQAKNVETVKFDVGNSKAFVGERFAGSPEIRLASVGGEQSTNLGEATIVFDQPVQPGSTVTVALAAQRNPHLGGVYEFGVTAYPVGTNGLGQFLGYGRINFYRH